MRKKRQLAFSAYSPEDLARLKKEELDIAREIKRICEKNDIPFFAVGGTAIGAVRHGGFIPWDDDMDFGMVRKDYDRFLELAEKELQSDYCIASFEKFREFPPYFIKVCKKRTLFVESGTQRLHYPHGIFVDIFPFDNVPEDEFKKEKRNKRILFWHQLFTAKVIPEISHLSPRRSIFARLVRRSLYFLLKPISRRWLYKKLDYWLRKYNSTPTATVMAAENEKSEVSLLDLFPAVPFDFDGLSLPLPHAYDAVLRKGFGNYMVFPPLEARVSHKPLILSFDEEAGA